MNKIYKINVIIVLKINIIIKTNKKEALIQFLVRNMTKRKNKIKKGKIKIIKSRKIIRFFMKQNHNTSEEENRINEYMYV